MGLSCFERVLRDNDGILGCADGALLTSVMWLEGVVCSGRECTQLRAVVHPQDC